MAESLDAYDYFCTPLVGVQKPEELIVHNAVSLMGLADKRYCEAFRDNDVKMEAERATEAHFRDVLARNGEENLGKIVGVNMRVRRYLRHVGVPLTLVDISPFWSPPVLPKKHEAVTRLPTFALASQLRQVDGAPRRTVGYVAVASPEQLTILTRGLAFKVIPPEIWIRIKVRRSAGKYDRNNFSAQATETEPGHPVKYPEGSVVAMDVPIVDCRRFCKPIPTIPNSPRSNSEEVVLLNEAVSIEPKKTRRSDAVADAFALRWFHAESSYAKKTVW